MKAQQLVRASHRGAQPLHPFEVTLKELTFNELLHLSAVLHRDTRAASRRRIEMVRKELSGRKVVPLEPSLTVV